MSSQRRESRWQRKDCMAREGADGQVSPAPIARHSQAGAGSETARPKNSASLVTNPLQKDLRKARLVSKDVGRSWRGFGTFGASLCKLAGPIGSARSSLSPISLLSGSAPPHLTLPQAPAAKCRRAERYDGKGNLHFKHAA